jgi:hypothetical protein
MVPSELLRIVRIVACLAIGLLCTIRFFGLPLARSIQLQHGLFRARNGLV